MPGPVVKFPKIDAANVASKLPDKLRQPAGAALQVLLDLVGADDPNQIMGTAAGVKIPQLGQELSSGLAKELMKRARSPILRDSHLPNEVGSGDVASLLSGVRPNTRITVGVPWAPMSLQAQDVLKPWELKAAREEFYEMSQKALEKIGVKPDEAVDLYRTGFVPQSKYLLTPTHVDSTMTDYWGRHKVDRGPQSVKYEVPRTDISGLLGLLRRGDDLTAGEVLVPAGVLRRVTKMLPENVQNPVSIVGSIEDILKRIPAWAKHKF